MNYISIRNWEKYQHYKHRNPPWIKLHQSLLDDYEFCCLQDDSKLLLMSLFLLACKTDNKIPNDIKWIKQKSTISGKIDLRPLFDIGFITTNGNASEMLASYKQKCGTEKSREEKEIETEKSMELPPCDAEPICKIPLIARDGEFEVQSYMLAEYHQIYPGMDVERAVQFICKWNKDNPGKRKTRKGIQRHITTFMDSLNNKGKFRRLSDGNKKSGGEDDLSFFQYVEQAGDDQGRDS